MSINQKITQPLNKSTVVNWIFLLSTIVFSSLLHLFHNETISIISIFLVSLSCLIIGKFDIMHPYTWFIPPLTLYFLAHPLLVILGEARDYGHLSQLLVYQWVALCIIVLIITPFRINYGNIPFDKFKKQLTESYLVLIKPLFYTSILLIFIFLSYVISNGITSKRQLALDNSLFSELSSFFSVFTLSFGLILSIYILHKRSFINFAILGIVIGVLIFLIAGERNIVLSIVWITGFLINVLYKRIKKIVLFTSVALIIIIIPISNIFKNFIVSGSVNSSLDFSEFHLEILRSEFQAASRNFHHLIYEFNNWNFFYGETLVWDFMRAFFPFSNFISPTQWFTEEFNNHVFVTGGGRGFSILAEGYMNFGVLGVIIWSIILGVYIKFLYKLSGNSVIWLNIYILSMPILIYVTRADFANLLSQTVKQIIFPIIVMLIIYVVIRKKRVNKLIFEN